MVNQGHPLQRSRGAPAQMPRAPAWSLETMLSEAGITAGFFDPIYIQQSWLHSPVNGSYPPDLLSVRSAACLSQMQK